MRRGLRLIRNWRRDETKTERRDDANEKIKTKLNRVERINGKIQ
jgi:hypothetical protein